MVWNHNTTLGPLSLHELSFDFLLLRRPDNNLENGSEKLLLTTKESIVSSSIFSGPPCILYK